MPLGYFRELNEFLFMLKVSLKKVILVGDFNLGGIDWAALGTGGSEVSCSEEFLDLAFSHNLTQVVKEHTRVQGESQSLIDLIFVSETLSRHTHDCKTHPGISDHKMVHFEISLEATLKKTEVSS